MYPHIHYQEDSMPVALSYRGDVVVTVHISTEVGEELEIVLDRRNAFDLRNMLEIWLER